jgi:nucleoside-triphosphatase
MLSTKNLLLTGRPGCGKTTVFRRLIERLADLRLAGFYTQELRENRQRVGFEAIGLSKQRAILAHVESRSRPRVGRYGVDPEQLQPLVQIELQKPPDSVDAFLIDEIGKMELLCPAFVEVIPRLLDGTAPVLATVALKGTGLIAGVKSRPDVEIQTVTTANRDELPEILEHWVRKRMEPSRAPDGT